jgi:hypothetical protein
MSSVLLAFETKGVKWRQLKISPVDNFLCADKEILRAEKQYKNYSIN